ncbi:hypothetical protein [Actinomadura sp. WAC 06369]|uniref:hypothetical protein n=1 Tax=Actinomadura sp. WAC 06369 TaxID=2203193 RepID=UPI000F7B2F4B|nr:hypothetical protein [Actinomadura sp. WAC 06369]
MSDPQTTRPDFPGTGGPPFGERSAAAPRPIGPVRRVLQAFGAIAGVQFLAAAVALLVLTSYRRAAADWLLPLIAVADLLVTVQIGWLAIRDVRLSGRRTTGPRLVLAVLVLGAVAGAVLGGRAVLRHLDRPAEAAFGAPAMDGDLRFTASAPECGHTVKRIAVRGVMCRVRVVVANTGSVEARFEARVQRLHGEDSHRVGALLAKGRRTYPAWTLAPGASVRGYLVFDVPRGFAPRALDLRAAEGAEGVRFPVG